MHYERNSRKLIQLIEERGWYLVEVGGSHHQFKHPDIPGRLTVPHPKKDLGIGLAKAIYLRAGLTQK